MRVDAKKKRNGKKEAKIREPQRKPKVQNKVKETQKNDKGEMDKIISIAGQRGDINNKTNSTIPTYTIGRRNSMLHQKGRRLKVR